MRVNSFFKVWYLILAVPFLMLTSCGDDDSGSGTPSGATVASFQSEVDSVNFLLVRFTNFSQNATSYAWDFGDSETSTEENPEHQYAAAGTYTVTLTATGANGTTSSKSNDVTVTDPNAALTLLTGPDSKTWKLFREGTSMSLGESKEIPNNWWPGLENDGSRDCLYEQTFTFHRDGTYAFDDMGSFWGEFGVWDPADPNYETCFPAEAANMRNLNGDDVSAWLSGTHAFTYDANSSEVTLTGDGAWIGIPKLGPTGESVVPLSSTTFKIEAIGQATGYDTMVIGFDYGTGGYWKFVYVNYSDPSLEPDLGSGGGGGGFGEDLPDETPTAMFNTFASTDAADVQELVPTASDVTINIGVTDPDGGATAVGEYVRGTAAFADLKFQLDYDAQFDNFDSVVVEVYFPSTNDYSGALTQVVDIFIADASATEQFWTDWALYRNDATTAQDTWVRFAWALSDVIEGVDPKTRTDFDLIGLKIGSDNHDVDGTFYIRNFEFK
ncbi:MAG: PKD domain-containing protein [Cytophagales bacterium]